MSIKFRLFKPSTQSLMGTLLNPLRRMQARDYELVTMAGFLLWNTDGKQGVSQTTEDAAVKAKDAMCNDLHSKYNSSDETRNYALRLSQMMALIAAIEVILKQFGAIRQIPVHFAEDRDQGARGDDHGQDVQPGKSGRDNQ